VPKGLLEDAPETLSAWLEHPGLTVLVDGYNVTLAEGGYGDIGLAEQRARLLDDLSRLARRVPARFVVVFDGADVPPGSARRARGPVLVEYSRPGEIADDHLVARLEELPPEPVVVVTNDRDLQARARRLGATVATSDQLLALLR
jgi:predicted RNA-binding protein with PIN domain